MFGKTHPSSFFTRIQFPWNHSWGMQINMSLWPHLDTSLRWVVVVLLLLLIMRTFVSDDRDTQRYRAWGWHDPDGNGLSTTITTRRRLNGSFKGSGTTTRYSRNHQNHDVIDCYIIQSIIVSYVVDTLLLTLMQQSRKGGSPGYDQRIDIIFENANVFQAQQQLMNIRNSIF